MRFWGLSFRYPITLGVLLLAGCGGAGTPPAPPPDVGVLTLKSRDIVLTTELPGLVAAVEKAEVRPQINGIVRRRLFTEGSAVRAGQVLYEIEDASYRAAMGSAQGALARAQAAIDATANQAERYDDLARINAVSQQDAENARSAARQSRADVTAQAAAVQAARVNLEFTRIRAPISGTIGRSLITPGALVMAGQGDPLAVIQRTDRVYVDVTQSAAQLLDLRQAMQGGGLAVARARVQLILPNGTTYPIEGRLEFSEVAVNPATGAVTLRASFPNPDGMLLPGMYVRARIVEGIRRQALLVPQPGIMHDPRGRATALVVNARNTVEQRFVTIDRAEGNQWLVTAGLRAGDRLIVDGLMRAKPGVVVHPSPVADEGAKVRAQAAAAPAGGA